MALENVSIMPKWNQKSTAAERFEELAVMARKNPEKFEKVVVVWNAVKEDRSVTNYALVGIVNVVDAYGLLKLGELEVTDVTRGR